VCQRGGVPHYGVAFAGQQQRDCDIGVVLPKFDGRTSVVEHSALVLAQTVETFREIRGKPVFNVKCLLAIQFSRFVGAGNRVPLAQEILAPCRAELDVAPLERELNLQRIGGEDRGISCF
jgi:hypothetical protein